MVEAGVIDDMAAGQMTQQLLLGATNTPTPQMAVSPPVKTLGSGNYVISEDEKNDV